MLKIEIIQRLFLKATLTANSALYDAVGKMSSQILLNREALLDGKK